MESGSTPIGKNIKEQTVNVDGTEQPQKIFTVEKAGALKEINFKFAKKPSKEELKFLTDLRQGLIDGNKYKVKVKGKLKKDITITQIKSQGDEMEKLLKEGGLQNDLDNLFPGVGGTLSRVESDLTEFDFTKVGSGEATKKIEEVL